MKPSTRQIRKRPGVAESQVAAEPLAVSPVESTGLEAAEEEIEPVHPESSWLRRIHPHYAFLIALPWVVFLINPNWLFQGFGHMDPWYYFGMSINYPRYQHIFLAYPGERVTWILPARLFVALFTPIYGWLLFHLCVYWTSVFSLYFIIRRFAGGQAALLAAAAMACHPMFLGSNGWSYVESGSLAYLLASFAALTAAARRRDPAPLWILGGILWALAAYNNLFWWVLSPAAVLVYYGTLNDVQTRNLRRHIMAGLWFFLGLVITTCALITCLYLVFGQTDRILYSEQFTMALWGVRLKEPLAGDSSLNWAKTAGWIVFPLLTLFASAFALAGHFLGRKLPRFALAMVLAYLYTFAVMAYFTYHETQFLRYDYYASILIPFEFLVLGVLLFSMPWDLPARTLYALVGGATLITILPMWRVTFYTPGTEKSLVWHYVLGAAAIAAGLTAKRSTTWIASIAALAVAGFGLTPSFTNAWIHNFNGIAATRRVVDAIHIIDAQTPQHLLPYFWFSNDDPRAAEYRAIMCAYVSHLFSATTYPKVDPARKFPPGTEVVLLTGEKDVFDQSNAVATEAGMPLKLKSRHLISGQSATWGQPIRYWMTITEVLPPPEGLRQ